MSTRPSRVLQVVTDTDRRGAQVFAAGLAHPLGQLGWDVRTVALAPGAVGGLDLEVLGSRPRQVATLRALRRAMADVEVVVAHGSTTLPASLIARSGGGPPVIYRQISDPAYWTPTWSRRQRVRLYYRGTAHVVALDDDVRQVLQQRFMVPAAQVTVIPNAVDAARFPRADAEGRAAARRRLSLPPDARVVGVVGALAPEKGLDQIIDVLPPGAVLLVAGDGPEAGALRRRADATGTAARFLGRVDDPWDVYAAADVIALPSRSEGQPATLIEAGLVGTVVVASRVGSIPEIVEDGVTGVLVAPGDGAALGHEIRRALDDPAAARGRGAAAADRMRDRFVLDAVAPQWAEVLTAQASRGRRRAGPRRGTGPPSRPRRDRG